MIIVNIMIKLNFIEVYKMESKNSITFKYYLVLYLDLIYK